MVKQRPCEEGHLQGPGRRLCGPEAVPGTTGAATKGTGVSVDLPAIETAADAVQANGRVVALVGAGELLPSKGQALAAIIETQRKAIETEGLVQRIAALEAM
jgi:hypothetical protein